MTIYTRILCLSAALLVAFEGKLLIKNILVTGSSDCESIYDFPCENGECIDSGLWCDSSEDCLDGSDEKYCRRSSLFKTDPNKCSSDYFRCNDGPCIPKRGLCDGYENCGDGSDEKNCQKPDAMAKSSGHSETVVPVVTENYQTTSTIALPEKSQIDGNNAALYFLSINASNSIEAKQFSGYSFSAFSEQRNRARNWLLYQRRGDLGWGHETPRSLTALYLSDQGILRNTESDLLMIKQLEIQLSLELARNETKPMKLTDLALYINALHVSCKDPKNFYGDNMVGILRDGVNAANAAQKNGKLVNPSIYLTLCINNATTNEDSKKLHEIFFNWNDTMTKLHIQSLALLATSCIFKRTSYLNASIYDSMKMEFLRNVKDHGFPGNVYEAALLFQALQELHITLTGLADFILKQQQADGSFGDILSTYLVLPILAGRNLVQMNDCCGQQKTPDLIPLEVLKNVKSKKIHVYYSLNYGFPPEIKQTLQMHVAKGTNFLDIMRLAQEINPKYRFKLSENREVPVVYSVGNMPNDVEKGMYWTLYTAFGNSSEITSEENWDPYNGDIKKLILAEGDKVLFWYRPI